MLHRHRSVCVCFQFPSANFTDVVQNAPGLVRCALSAAVYLFLGRSSRPQHTLPFLVATHMFRRRHVTVQIQNPTADAAAPAVTVVPLPLTATVHAAGGCGSSVAGEHADRTGFEPSFSVTVVSDHLFDLPGDHSEIVLNVHSANRRVPPSRS